MFVEQIVQNLMEGDKATQMSQSASDLSSSAVQENAILQRVITKLFDGLVVSLDIKKIKSVICVYVMFHGNYGYQCKIHNFIITICLRTHSATRLNNGLSN